MTLTTSTKCKFCGAAESDHEGRVHSFVAEGEAGRLPSPKELKQRGALKQAAASAPEGSNRTPSTQSGDIALRLALLQAGVITPTQLEEAEKRLEQGGLIIVREEGQPGGGDPEQGHGMRP
jgi:hypothetical protein